MSSVWDQNDKVRILWITMLALKDSQGKVNASITGLANSARMSIPDAEKALKVLMAPDPYSRSKESQGKRVAECEGGWIILNFRKYRDMIGKYHRKEMQAEYQRTYRAKKNGTASERQYVKDLQNGEVL